MIQPKALLPTRLMCGHELMLYEDTPDGQIERCFICDKDVPVNRCDCNVCRNPYVGGDDAREGGVVVQNG